MRPRPSDDPVMNTRATLTPPVMPSYRLTNPNALPAPRVFPFTLCAARRRRAASSSERSIGSGREDPLRRFARDSPLEGDGFERPVPRVLEPSQFIRLLDTAFGGSARPPLRILAPLGRVPIWPAPPER